jgi:hypothetical protein
VLKADGQIVLWGGNEAGQSNVPAGLSSVIAIAAGSSHNLALKADGTVVAWGRNDVGQANVPANLSDVIAIAAGELHSLALRADGTVVAWGTSADYFNYGQATVPEGLSNVTTIAAGNWCNLALVSPVSPKIVQNPSDLFTPASPLMLTAPQVLPDGSLVFTSSNSGGQELLPEDLASIAVQASTNLRDWITLPGTCTLTNGLLQIHDASCTNLPQRFYRIVER